MPSYNTENYIADSIRSVLDQSYADWELLIVDDCSTDHTEEVVGTFLADPRIKFFKNRENSGAAVSRNAALREAKGRWIAFLDSDDLWLPEKLEHQIRFMEENHCRFSYTNYHEIDENGSPLGVFVTGPKHITRTGFYNYCWPGCLTVMYDRDAIGLIQAADIRKNNDYAMWLEISRHTDCYLLDEDLAQYRRGRSGSISTHGILTMIGWHYRLFRDAEHQNMVRSIFNTCRNMLFGVYKKVHYTRIS